MNNSALILALVVGLVVGTAVGYYWGLNEGKSVNTVEVGRDFKLQWKNQP